MVELARELAHLGHNVTYVAEQPMSAERLAQGWVVPDVEGINLEYAPDAAAISALAASAPSDSIHICQGIRGNGLVGAAQTTLKARGLRQWVVMEVVDSTGWNSAIKRFAYSRRFSVWRDHLRGVLAIGCTAPDWIVARGMPSDRVLPFAYFLGNTNSEECVRPTRGGRFRFVFVGQFIARKRLDLLLEALHCIHAGDFELTVIGTGPQELALQNQAEKLLPGRVRWVGRLPLEQVPTEMARADCIVLPSRHDGWGAVISEALMVGTQAICSDACGAADVVVASGRGGVFRKGDRSGLAEELERVLTMGVVKDADRLSLAKWAGCLGAKAGARYLLDILDYDSGSGEKPVPPWDADS